MAKEQDQAQELPKDYVPGLSGASPQASNTMLIVTLIVTAFAVVLILRSRSFPAEVAVPYLMMFMFLFFLRVVGQVYVLLGAPSWLPPVEGENWNLVPYRILLPSQIAILVLMGFIMHGVWNERAPFGERHRALGMALITASAVYAGVMALRYVVRMTRRPEQRWFGGAIPIVFHMVLAAFLLAWGRYHVSG